MEIKETDRETVSDFRSHHLLDASLIWDSWDEVSRHFATFENGAIVSTLRVSSEIGLRLPFHDAANICLPIQQGSVEIGRALSIAHRKALNGFTSWLRWMYESPDRSLIQGNIYIDSLLTRERHTLLTRLGFLDTGIKYIDSRYNTKSGIYVGLPSSLNQYANDHF